MSAVEHLEILVEEPSMVAFLEEFLPRVLGREVSFAVHGFNGKPDLLKKLPGRLLGYSRWLPPGWGLLILVDQDSDDCKVLKERLERMARAAGFSTRSTSQGQPYRLANRIVVKELEAWYFGDWLAVQRAFPRVSSSTTNQAKFRDPDRIPHPWETFERTLQRKNYFTGGLQKIAVAREISKAIDPERNRSPSFQVFYQVLLEMKHGSFQEVDATTGCPP